MTDNTPHPSHPPHTFLDAGGFTYSAQVRPIPRPQGSFHLRIASRWTGARNPGDEQTALSLTLTREELAVLTATLQAALAE